MSKTAVVFPGQGSQKLGMLQDYYENFETFRNIVDEAKEHLGYDLWNIIQNDEETLSKTEFTQPALLATSYAIYEVLKEQKPDLKIAYFAGHSLGEYTALLAAGCISYKDALQLVSTRGKLMQNAVTDKECAMSAILGLSNEDVIKSCQEASDAGIVEAANFNSTGQVVISGEKAAVEKANTIAKEKGAKRAQILAVSVPSHCSLMKDAADKFEAELNKVEFKEPTTAVVQNFDAKSHANPAEIKTAVIKQLYKPVLWTQSIEKLVKLGVTEVIECGPNKVLSGLIKRIDKSIDIKDTNSIDSLENI
ncbi:ACP S-malonyltransferase [Francisella tularensis]|uniref:ACP S-malonyltransferase n=1 Tax=Francisella tularensis TaxID=263 RepID=UPI001022DBAD|nr:ACP S-malonyltransferase [Francisella tularensis]MDN9007159.1 ACP S-malonyltransferase [Francisella tularensis subsp. mediasiatica]RZP33005.1 [acyl-carrier-protein] S-malonyltransferase [Francisella tularensis subsp. mediasiatica]RZP36929.1 [acyl-carrier-protein] S-malonyltransferase [Francisella tularensis subsp. mediasiatica]RZP40620.1 [acyl-carrier-protein] S-malonyltransferase [Francisella tularensis subsp. mediasiatica]WKL71202.1 ACP S-malonyltransferase [Francisella tularensis subsp. 